MKCRNIPIRLLGNEIFRWIKAYIKFALLAVVIVLVAYFYLADPKVESFGSFIEFIQKGLWINSIRGANSFMPFYVLWRLYVCLAKRSAGQQEATNSKGEVSCGGK
jgi:hypothetical protein